MARLIADKFATWEAVCSLRFHALKRNEEQLNRIFADIYGLEDQLTFYVEDRAVSVRKADLKREIKSLISYAVGTLFGRYSLDVPGIAYAGGKWEPKHYVTVQPVEDNILLLREEPGSTPDAAELFFRWVATVYGRETLEENLSFIAQALGGEGTPRLIIRRYLFRDFYADHLKIYQKRPIYWQLNSGKQGHFRALIYIHRYRPDLLNQLLTSYVQPQLKNTDSGELRKFETQLRQLAMQSIHLDLDDGIQANYEKFPGLFTPIR